MDREPEPELRRLIANVTSEQYEYVRVAAFKRRVSISQYVRDLIEAERRARPAS
jgi:hypothetical protein